ncbi:hypothetical protein I3F58_16820 [Streptomyces sp. MUM 203J]|nr:hypothetical protein [Streptomyces sp. MUM 203J]
MVDIVDMATGTVRLKAKVENADETTPGRRPAHTARRRDEGCAGRRWPVRRGG